MITFSAFADEISQDLQEQMDACAENGVYCIDVRLIDKTNVSKMSLPQVKEYKQQMDDRGFTVPCIGSPLGKISMADDFEAHLDVLKHCIEVAHTFGTKRIRMFSFYPPPNHNIADQRAGVMERITQMVEVAKAGDAVLYHENEKAIYGAVPERVLDIFKTIKSEHLKGIFDPANYVEEGVAPYDQGWTKGLAEFTDYFHVKDKVPGADTCAPAGHGKGQFDEIFADLKAREFDGYMTLEPHMAAAGQFSGYTGSDLFKTACDALKAVCDKAGLAYNPQR